MRTVITVARFLFIVAILWTQTGRTAAYDPKPVSYTGVVADNVQVTHDHIMAGVDDFIITATKGKETQKFILTCNGPEKRLNILYWLKDITGGKASGATGMTIQYYPEGVHQMKADADQPLTLFNSQLSPDLTRAASRMLDYKKGSFVFHFYENDGISDHGPLAWSWQYPAPKLAPALAGALVSARANNCSLAQGETRIASLVRLADH
ncbi:MULTISPECIES: hypothetical protein [Enterobacteriaceae]|uniref:hypothetical protein n=1 Tax=Enterobacteriaceae TaxID=543 RepID=UPI002004C61D|nr:MULTISPECIES: hypothetical protein [Enterobacteriaceae]MCK7121356.1 hypothetical protein [Enterobacter roggenkampii]MDT3619148.1 hypothetical protein [Cronobacter sakazakii]HDO7177580.1 hypothetical protein [Klebsiella pneumoniae]HDO7188046.1 hypothetical protein [Klebsiella pneumoniae]